MSRLYALIIALDQAMARPAPRGGCTHSALNEALWEYACKYYLRNGGAATATLCPDRLRQRLEERPPVFVAIKRINATSGPKRIAEELLFLRDLKGLHNVIPIVTAFRLDDQVIAISPFFHGIDFRELLVTLKVADVAGYLRLLLEALAHVHSNHIMHRDIKPSNFMFARDRGGTYRGLLVDFGLAQIEEQEHAKRAKTVGRKNEVTCPESLRGARLLSRIQDLPPGYLANDPRVPMKASRAGTRGFRAPEVLFKVAHQTVAIDLWSVGVILLTLLTRRYPFFHSTDDCDALVELACIFGNDEMAAAARSYDRIWSCNIPSVPSFKLSWRHLCERLNPNWSEAVPDEAYDLLDRLMDLNYHTRISALEALDHPFLAKY